MEEEEKDEETEREENRKRKRKAIRYKVGSWWKWCKERTKWNSGKGKENRKERKAWRKRQGKKLELQGEWEDGFFSSC